MAWTRIVFEENAPGVPSRRSAHSAAVYQDRLYIFGGWDGLQELGDLFCYDPSAFPRGEDGQWS